MFIDSLNGFLHLSHIFYIPYCHVIKKIINNYAIHVKFVCQMDVWNHHFTLKYFAKVHAKKYTKCPTSVPRCKTMTALFSIGDLLQLLFFVSLWAIIAQQRNLQKMEQPYLLPSKQKKIYQKITYYFNIMNMISVASLLAITLLTNWQLCPCYLTIRKPQFLCHVRIFVYILPSKSQNCMWNNICIVLELSISTLYDFVILKKKRI